jgi:hypothetical protein
MYLACSSSGPSVSIRPARRLLTAKQALTEHVNRHVHLLKTQSALMLKLSPNMPPSNSSTPQAPHRRAESPPTKPLISGTKVVRPDRVFAKAKAKRGPVTSPQSETRDKPMFTTLPGIKPLAE